jgi:hypothetical protein
MKTVSLITLFAALLFPYRSFGVDISPGDVLTIEQASPSMIDHPFETGSDDEPVRSDFGILNQILMSNKKGERWATITLSNLSSGQRIFSVDQLLAVFANGDKRPPGPIQLKLAGGETGTYTFYFGAHKFPILYVYSRN